MEKEFWDLIASFEELYQEQPCFLYYNEKNERTEVSYGDFLRDIRCRVRDFLAIKESRLVIWSYNSYLWVVNACAAFLSGKHLIMMDANLDDENIQGLSKYSDAEAVLAGEDLLEDAPEIYELPVYSMQPGTEPADPSEFREGDFMCFTSGTSKSAKGVVVSLKALVECIRLRCLPIHAEKGERTLMPLPLHHIYGFTETFHILKHGGIVCVSKGARYLEKNLKDYQPQLGFFVPTMVQFLISRGNFPETLHTIITGGGYCRPEYEGELAEKGIKLFNEYGLSETLGGICQSDSKGILWLKPSPGVEFSALETGEVVMELPFHMEGYYKKEEDTKAVLHGDTFYSGDDGAVDEDGYVTIRGRLRDTLVLENGEKLYSEDVDRELNDFENVKEAAAFLYEGKLAAAVVLEDPKKEEAFRSAWNEWNQSKMVSHRVRDLWIRKDAIPRTTTQKIKRFQITKEYAEYLKGIS